MHPRRTRARTKVLDADLIQALHRCFLQFELELQETAMQRLDEVSIEDLCSRARSAGVQCNAADMFDFMI